MSRPASLLFLENDPHDIELFDAALKNLKRPTTLHVVKSIAEAKTFLEKSIASAPPKVPDLVLVDLGLPGENGLDFIEWCKNNPHFTRVRTVVFSGSKASRDRSQAFKRGAGAFEVKPLTIDDLTVQLSRILSEWCD